VTARCDGIGWSITAEERRIRADRFEAAILCRIFVLRAQQWQCEREDQAAYAAYRALCENETLVEIGGES